MGVADERFLELAAAVLAAGSRAAAAHPEAAADLVLTRRAHLDRRPRAALGGGARRAGRAARLRRRRRRAPKPSAGPATRVVDAGGRLVLPGFNDSHIHLVDGALSLDRVDLIEDADLAGRAGTHPRLRGRATRRRPGCWAADGCTAPSRAACPRRSSSTRRCPIARPTWSATTGTADGPTRRRWPRPASRATRPTRRTARSSATRDGRAHGRPQGVGDGARGHASVPEVDAPRATPSSCAPCAQLGAQGITVRAGRRLRPRAELGRERAAPREAPWPTASSPCACASSVRMSADTVDEALAEARRLAARHRRRRACASDR